MPFVAYFGESKEPPPSTGMRPVRCLVVLPLIGAYLLEIPEHAKNSIEYDKLYLAESLAWHDTSRTEFADGETTISMLDVVGMENPGQVIVHLNYQRGLYIRPKSTALCQLQLTGGSRMALTEYLRF